MGKENKTMAMESHILENGRKVTGVDMEHMNRMMGRSMLVLGLMLYKKDLVYCLNQMGRNMRETGFRVYKTAKVNRLFLMVEFTLVNG